MDRNNDPPSEGVDILDDESNSNDYLPEPVAESEGDDFITVSNDSNTLMSTEPTVPPEGARHGRGPDKQYPPDIWERGAYIKVRRMYIEDSKRERLASLCTATYPLNCGPKQYPVNYHRICW